MRIFLISPPERETRVKNTPKGRATMYVEFECVIEKTGETYRFAVERSEIKKVVELPDTKAVAICTARNKGFFKNRRLYVIVKGTFEEVLEKIERKLPPTNVRGLPKSLVTEKSFPAL